MSVEAVQKSFPTFLEQINNLVKDHRELIDEPVLLAIYYEPDSPGRDLDDVYMFEVLDNFGANRVDADGQMLEVLYGATEAFPMYKGQNLHMILTNPVEFAEAVRMRWPLVDELRKALQKNRIRIVYEDPAAGHLLEALGE